MSCGNQTDRDDCVRYREIKNSEDTVKFQEDIDR